uniref:Uncharacterized protein n=1 Tax=Arundo donax TaxID=35708 RepID=A0A0A9D9F5_ARUDO
MAGREFETNLRLSSSMTRLRASSGCLPLRLAITSMAPATALRATRRAANFASWLRLTSESDAA